MYKIHVHIYSEVIFLDDLVFIEIFLPAIPRKGDMVYLSVDHTTELEEMACKNLDIARAYAPKWFYGNSFHCNIPKEENLIDLSFIDAIYVTNVVFKPNDDIIYIELNSEEKI